MLTRKISLALSCLLITISISAQTPFFQHYNVLKKNEAVQVNTIFQDHSGLIWYGTNKGLFSFDGMIQNRFTVKDSLSDDNVTALSEDLEGNLWIGFKNGSISFFDKGKIKKFNPPEGTSTQPVSDILFDSNGVLWFSTYNDGLYYYLNNRLYRLDDEDGLPDLFIYDLLQDKDGNIWAGTDGGAVICKRVENKVNLQVINYKNGLPDNIIKKLALSGDGSIWMATEDAGIVSYDPKSQTLKPLMKSAWKFGSITDFVIRGNSFWISSMRNGLMVYDRTLDHTKAFNQKGSEGLTEINALYKDYEGNIWAGTKTDIMRTSGDNLEFIEDLGQSLRVNVLALVVDHRNDIWFSTNEGLFKRSVNPDGTVVILPQLKNTSFAKSRIISLYVDSDDFVWAGMFGEGVLRINPLSGKVIHLSKELRNGNILSITGKDNVIWLATLGGGVRIEIEKEKLSVKNITIADGLSSDYIYQIFIDSRNRLWFATDGSGVDMKDNNGFHHFEKGLTSKVVYGFAEDENKDIWINVQGDGLLKLDNSTFSLPKIRLRNNNITCLVTGRFGNLLIMHELGIDIYNDKQNMLLARGEEAGVKNRQANLNAFTKDKEGNIFIGTDNGIIKFSGQSFDNLVMPKPIIKGLKVLNKKINLSDDLVFKYDHNSIVIEYSGYWYENPENLNFKYKLDNYDLDWISSRDRSVTYSSLPAGDYTFRLMVSASEEFDKSPEVIVRFVVTPPFWRTTVFYILSVMILVGLGYGYVHYREKKLKSDKEILEHKVYERTLEIQRKTEEIQAQNEEILSQAEEIQGINENLELLVKERTSQLEKKNKALEEYAFINAHELRAPVARILGLIDLLVRSESEEEAQAIRNHLKNSAEKLNEIVRSITQAIERGDV